MKNSHFKGRRNAVSIISLKNGLFDNCVFSDTTEKDPRAGIDVEPNSASQIVSDITIRNCTFRDNHLGFITANANGNIKNIKILDSLFKNNSTGFNFNGATTYVENMEVSGCTFEDVQLLGNKNNGSAQSGVAKAYNVRIENNTFINCGKITISSSSDDLISSNIIVSKNKFIKSAGLEIRSGRDIKISENIIEDFTNFGIFVNKIDAKVTENIMINNNQIKGSEGGSSVAAGIRLDAGDEIIVKDNFCRKGVGDLMKRGIAIESATGQVTLAGNDCKDGGASYGILNSGTLVHLYQNRMKDGTWSDVAN